MVQLNLLALLITHFSKIHILIVQKYVCKESYSLLLTYQNFHLTPTRISFSKTSKKKFHHKLNKES